MNPQYCEFLAENEWVKIKPNFTETQLQLICGDVGPFEAGVPVLVPFWLAIFLKKRHSCEIVVPEWFTVDNLTKIVLAETDAPSFTPVPRFYLEMAQLILRYFKDDIVDGDQLRIHVLDLWDKRMGKMQASTMKFLSQVESCHARLDNITPIEVCYAKPPILEAIKSIDDFHSTLQAVIPS